MTSYIMIQERSHFYCPFIREKENWTFSHPATLYILKETVLEKGISHKTVAVRDWSLMRGGGTRKGGGSFSHAEVLD